MRHFVGMAVTALAALVAAPGKAPAESPHPVVLEMFTSQGCSSCPAADELLQTYAQRKDLIALSFSIHYWDNLGWKDTLASPQFTYRQKSYAKARGDGQVYTPQLVVNGVSHTVGSDKQAVDGAIHKAAHAGGPVVPVKLQASGSTVTIDVGTAAIGERDAVVWAVALSKRIEVAVQRGENAGKTLVYTNAVRGLANAGTYKGGPLTVRFDPKLLENPDVDACAAIVQAGGNGPILGAALIALK